MCNLFESVWLATIAPLVCAIVSSFTFPIWRLAKTVKASTLENNACSETVKAYIMRVKRLINLCAANDKCYGHFVTVHLFACIGNLILSVFTLMKMRSEVISRHFLQHFS